MEPEISVNDLIIIKTVEKYAENDIITYRTNKLLVTHRIIRFDGDKIYTKGDSNNTEDKPIYKEQIQGKVIKTFKGVGKVVDEKIMSILLIIFTVIIFISIILKKNTEED